MQHAKLLIQKSIASNSRTWGSILAAIAFSALESEQAWLHSSVKKSICHNKPASQVYFQDFVFASNDTATITVTRPRAHVHLSAFPSMPIVVWCDLTDLKTIKKLISI
jgi:hypothetical protein